MTVTYSAEVATSKGFGCFWKLLFRWRGSIYKLLWPDLGLYLSVYYFLSLIYRVALNEAQRRYFEKVSLYCKTYGDLIPVSFILGFYVSIVVKRWWDSFNCIPWPDTLAFFVSAYIHGQDDRGRLMRRSIMRYANLALVITLSCISPCVKKRFPTMDHLVDAGILLPNEKKVMEQLKTTHSTYWMPLVWASSIASRARKEGRVRDDFALNTLVGTIAKYRALCGGLYNYDWISIPLVYTQVVTLVVYTFFLSTLMGRQYLDPKQGHPGYDVDLYIPVFNFLQFFFYMGWLKVAETLVNPFGEDDDDFEVNWVIDRDIQVSYLIVDEMHEEHPELIKDQYWDEIMPDLPYTAGSVQFYSEPPMGSAANLVIPPHEAEFVPLETLEENDDDDNLSDVKVNGIPCETTNPLTHNLSGSSYSGLSKLGRSFHPRSYERKGILNMMQDFLSRESSVRKKKLWKAPSKDSTIGPSASCETSGPPTPDEYKDHSGFTDDIFHLSDLSLASKGTGFAQSPGDFSNIPVEDIFWQKKSDRQLGNLNRSVSKVSTPRSEVPDEESLRVPGGVLRKKSSNSLKQFFRSGRYRGSQKSLIDSAKRRSKLTLKNQSSEVSDGDSVINVKIDSEEEDKTSNNSEEEVTVMENIDNMSKSTNFIDAQSPQGSIPISFNQPRNSLPQTFNFSPTKLAKEPSTSTLVAVDGSLEGTPPLNDIVVNPTPPTPPKPATAPEAKPEPTAKAKESPKGLERSSLSQSVSPSQPKPPRRVPPRKYPKRAASLHINMNRKDSDTSSLSGLQKFWDRHRTQGFFGTSSQPSSPTGPEKSPIWKRKFPSRKGLFSRRDRPPLTRPTSTLEMPPSNPELIVSTPSPTEAKNVKNLETKPADV